MYGRISPAFVVKPAFGFEMLEIGHVGFRTPEFHIGNLEIRPKVAEIVGLAVVVRKEVECVVFVNIFRMQFREF
jgi:hypothetical protein